MKITVISLTALLWLSCKAQQVYDDEMVNVILKLQASMDLMFEHLQALSATQEAQSLKITFMEEHLRALSASQEEQQVTLRSGLQNMTEEILNSTAVDHKKLLPPLEKCSKVHDFIVNQNECSDGSNRCSEFAQCIDTIFSYKCRCLDGYSGDGFKCQKINPCLTNPCHPKAKCQNSGGNYTCTCEKPYEGDGDFCELSCQSLEGKNVGAMGCLTLVRTSMNFEDSRRECQSRGMRLLEDIPNREQFRDIWNAFTYGGWIRVGGKQRKWITSKENIHYSLYLSDQPDGRMDLCIALYVRSAASRHEGLNDDPCNIPLYSLCQYVPSD